jgi:hypothetical protein
MVKLCTAIKAYIICFSLYFQPIEVITDFMIITAQKTYQVTVQLSTGHRTVPLPDVVGCAAAVTVNSSGVQFGTGLSHITRSS